MVCLLTFFKELIKDMNPGMQESKEDLKRIKKVNSISLITLEVNLQNAKTAKNLISRKQLSAYREKTTELTLQNTGEKITGSL